MGVPLILAFWVAATPAAPTLRLVDGATLSFDSDAPPGSSENQVLVKEPSPATAPMPRDHARARVGGGLLAVGLLASGVAAYLFFDAANQLKWVPMDPDDTCPDPSGEILAGFIVATFGVSLTINAIALFLMDVFDWPKDAAKVNVASFRLFLEPHQHGSALAAAFNF